MAKRLPQRIASHLATIAICLASTVYSTAANYERDDFNLIPKPRHIEILGDKDIKPQAQELFISNDVPSEWHPEGYVLSITPKGIRITADDERGVLWAKRTLAQLRRPDGSYPHVNITDYPEFPIRGFLYDDGRNFVGVERIKGFIDILSEYKLNVFQWHLTDKPAWRIESHCHPRLNDGRFQRPGRDQGCFYTYDEIRDVIEYARQRGVTVIPEIDMPGHSDFFKTAFGVPMESPRGMKILEECLKEFFDEIPAEMCPYIHIGSDEVHIPDPEGFMKWAQELVRSHGRKTLAWDPGLVADSLTIRQFWRDGDPGQIEYPTDAPFVDSGMGYLNYYDPLLTPAKIYFHTPCGIGHASNRALGGIVCLWNDVRAEDKDLIAPHSGMLGGVMTFAERFWHGGIASDKWLGTLLPEPTSKEMADFEHFQNKMAVHKSRRLDNALSYWEPIHATPWRVEIWNDSVKADLTAFGDVIDLDALCRREGIPTELPLECRLTRRISVNSDTIALYKIGFDAPARSNRASDGIPAQGHWENFGSVIINGFEILPNLWNEPETYRFHYNTWSRLEEELPYTNEQLYWMRPPVKIALKKGDNTIELYLRKHFKGQRFQVGFVNVR